MLNKKTSENDSAKHKNFLRADGDLSAFSYKGADVMSCLQRQKLVAEILADIALRMVGDSPERSKNDEA